MQIHLLYNIKPYFLMIYVIGTFGVTMPPQNVLYVRSVRRNSVGLTSSGSTSWPTLTQPLCAMCVTVWLVTVTAILSLGLSSWCICQRTIRPSLSHQVMSSWNRYTRSISFMKIFIYFMSIFIFQVSKKYLLIN